ncbi:MAG: hypothetical protein EBT86_12940 [Actinobacteria bacterium]|nr:hypothetical protein [Actinomycetota bacterium]
MKISVEEILDLVYEVESEDPIDWEMLNIDENQAAELIVNSLVDRYNQEWSKLDSDTQVRAMMATIAKLVIENFSLNIKLRQ